jgi:hypothetical protein
MIFLHIGVIRHQCLFYGSEPKDQSKRAITVVMTILSVSFLSHRKMSTISTMSATSPWKKIRYPFGYLLRHGELNAIPSREYTRRNITPTDFAFIWLYVMMEDDTEKCNLDALILSLWGRYRDDSAFINMTVVTGEIFGTLVLKVRGYLSRTSNTAISTSWLWESSDVCLGVWFEKFSQRYWDSDNSDSDGKAEIDRNLHTWAVMVRLWDHAVLSEDMKDIENIEDVHDIQNRRSISQCPISWTGRLSWMIGGVVTLGLALMYRKRCL